MASNTPKIMEFLLLLGRLKTTMRTGWVIRGVQRSESVADHMYRMACMSFLTGSKDGLDKDKCIKLSLVHDMAECIVGDLAPADGVSKEEKHNRERKAMEHLQGLVDVDTGRELFTLWQEYETQSTKEAKFVKDLDRFEMILQAHEYEQAEHRTGDSLLQDFYDSTNGKFDHPKVQDWVLELYKMREDAIQKRQQVWQASSSPFKAVSQVDTSEESSSASLENTPSPSPSRNKSKINQIEKDKSSAANCDD